MAMATSEQFVPVMIDAAGHIVAAPYRIEVAAAAGTALRLDDDGESSWPSATTSSTLTRISLSLPAAGETTGISIFMASTKARSSPSLTLSADLEGKSAYASGQFGNHLGFRHSVLPGPFMCPGSKFG